MRVSGGGTGKAAGEPGWPPRSAALRAFSRTFRVTQRGAARGWSPRPASCQCRVSDLPGFAGRGPPGHLSAAAARRPGPGRRDDESGGVFVPAQRQVCQSHPPWRSGREHPCCSPLKRISSTAEKRADFMAAFRYRSVRRTGGVKALGYGDVVEAAVARLGPQALSPVHGVIDRRAPGLAEDLVERSARHDGPGRAVGAAEIPLGDPRLEFL
jgi:hypothetical protein